MKEFYERLFDLADDYHRTLCHTDCNDCEMSKKIKVYTKENSSHTAIELDLCQLLQDIHDGRENELNE